MDTGSSLDERRARTQERERARRAQAQIKKAQAATKKAAKKQHEKNMYDLEVRLANTEPFTEGGTTWQREERERKRQEASDTELAVLFGKAMEGVRTAGTKKPKAKAAKKRTPVKSGYTADRSVIQPGQLDEVVRGMGSGALQRSRNIRDQRTAAGRSRQVADRRGLRIQDPNDLSESMGKMGMGMPRRKSRRKSRKSRRKSRKSRRKSRKSRRKSRKSRRKASRKKSRRKSKSRRKASRKKSKRRKSRRKSKSRRKASRKKSRRKSRRKVYG